MRLVKGTRVIIEGLHARPEPNGRLAVVEEDFIPGAAQSRVLCRLLMATGGAVHLPGALLGVKLCNVKVAPVVPDAKEDATAAREVRETLENAMGPDIADAVSKHLKCTRCLGSCEADTPCRVEHPPHLQVNTGSSFGPNGEP